MTLLEGTSRPLSSSQSLFFTPGFQLLTLSPVLSHPIFLCRLPLRSSCTQYSPLHICSAPHTLQAPDVLLTFPGSSSDVWVRKGQPSVSTASILCCPAPAIELKSSKTCNIHVCNVCYKHQSMNIKYTPNTICNIICIIQHSYKKHPDKNDTVITHQR